MKRLSLVLVIVVSVAVGAAIGALGRSWVDGASRPGQALRESAPVATTVPAASVAPPKPAPPRPTAPPLAGRDVVLEVSEAELQAQLARMLVGQSLGATPLGEATIQSVTVALRDRQVRVGGAARAGLLSAPFSAAGTVAPDANGRPLVQVSEAAVGGVLLPDAVRLGLADSLQTQVDGLLAAQAVQVRAIDIADGRMRVVGTARP